MTVDATVKLSTLSPNTTFQAGESYGIVVDPTGLTSTPGLVWNMNLATAAMGQTTGDLDVIPVPLKVVHV